MDSMKFLLIHHHCQSFLTWIWRSPSYVVVFRHSTVTSESDLDTATSADRGRGLMIWQSTERTITVADDRKEDLEAKFGSLKAQPRHAQVKEEHLR